MGTDLSMTFNSKYKVSDKDVRTIIKIAKEKLNCPPSYPLTLFNYESYWGYSNVGTKNNNWGGMSWSTNWKAPHKRSSGVTITRGSLRPKRETGHYIKYKTMEDYFIDWAWLMRRGGVYRVADKKTFQDCIKGMFIYGGANRDYAEMGQTNSKRKYELYYTNMVSRRNAINKQNNGLLDKIDSGNYEWGENPPQEQEDYPDTVFPILRDVESLLLSIQNEFTGFQSKIYNSILDMLKVKIYDLSENTMGNKYIRVDKLLDNMYMIKPNLDMNLLLSNIIKNTNNTLIDFKGDISDIVDSKKGIESEEEDSEDISKYPAFPTTKGLRISSKYGFRGDIGVEGASKYHKGIDISGAKKHHPIYATQDGKVTRNEYSNSGGHMIFLKHTSDNYYSCYLHMKEKSKIPVGVDVKKGEEIGTMGSTGYSSGIHLHFGISKNGNFTEMENTINPEDYLRTKL